MAFSIGDRVWRATFESQQKYVTCPDCCGQRALTVILGDGSQVSIDCEACRLGYHPSAGIVGYYEHTAKAAQSVITRIEIGDDVVKYGSADFYSEEHVFAEKEDAERRAEELAAEWNESQLRRIYEKEKPTRTWGWHVTYHRKEIKRCERELEYHKAKLAVAKLKAKEAP